MSALIKFAESQYQLALQQLESAQHFLDMVKKEDNSKPIDEACNWVYISQLESRIGLSINAARGRISRGDWIEGREYKREKPGKRTRLIFNIGAIQIWLEKTNTPVSSSTEQPLESGSTGKAGVSTNRSTSRRRQQTGRQPPGCVMKFINE